MTDAMIDIFTPADIHRYVDGDLNTADGRALCELLEEDPERMAELRAYERQNALLAKQFSVVRAG